MWYSPGYCPQFDAVFGEMTGRENLRFFSKLRGIQPEHAAASAEALAHALGFYKHLDKRVRTYVSHLHSLRKVDNGIVSELD